MERNTPGSLSAECQSYTAVHRWGSRRRRDRKSCDRQPHAARHSLPGNRPEFIATQVFSLTTSGTHRPAHSASSWPSEHQRIPTEAEHHSIINNIPKTVLIIAFPNSSMFCHRRRFLLNGGGRGDPKLDDYVGSAATAVTIGHWLI